jgi:outer membrane lipoprotein LolB
MSVWSRLQKIISLTFSVFFAAIFIAGCATNTPASGTIGTTDTENSITSNTPPRLSYQGRLSLRIESTTSQSPPQSLYGAFGISGDAQTGELSLNSPLGNTVAKLTWTPQTAILVANNTTTSYPSTEALITTVTGTALPLPALFDWLAGISTPIEGWEVDLSNMQNLDNRRLVAKRVSPLPAVELRIALEQP